MAQLPGPAATGNREEDVDMVVQARGLAGGAERPSLCCGILVFTFFFTCSGEESYFLLAILLFSGPACRGKGHC